MWIIWFASVVVAAVTIPSLMRSTPASVRCGKCRQYFETDGYSLGPWSCPHCEKKNPNLRRHYRSIVMLFTIMVVAPGVRAIGMFLLGEMAPKDALMEGLFLLPLVITIAALLRSRAPWNDTVAKVLIWVVIFLPLFAKLVFFPGLQTDARADEYAGVTLALYAVLFCYLIWLHHKGKRLCSRRSPDLPSPEVPRGGPRAGVSEGPYNDALQQTKRVDGKVLEWTCVINVRFAAERAVRRTR